VIEKPFTFILAAIIAFREKLTLGFELKIESQFASDLGLGSSAAVTVATVAVLAQYLQNEIKLDDIFIKARRIVQEVQGIASGADVAASVYGGVILYQTKMPCVLKRFVSDMPIVALYSGVKTPTIEVIQTVQALQAIYPEIYEKLFEAIDCVVNAAIPCLEEKNWQQLGVLLKMQQGMMNALGVGTKQLDELVHLLNTTPGIYGAKISGSGLGDCVIGIGSGILHEKEILVKISQDGLNCE
jgi:mevalonate kinase